MNPASHPRTCRVCSGTGWQPGPGIPGHHHGKAFEYTTVEPCTHHWANDDPDVDEHGYDTTTMITFDQYFARLAWRIGQGDELAVAELEWWERTGRTWDQP